MSNYVIVGGGISGIYAAILLRKAGHNVHLIEQAPYIGGLLNSIENEHGDIFDFGTHFIAGTGKPEIDADIIPKEWQEDWYGYSHERGSNYFAGSLDDDCIHLDTNKLGKEIHDKALLEIIATLDYAEGDNFVGANCEETVLRNYGPTLTENLFKPVLKKLYGVGDLKLLDRNAHLRFAIRRLLVSTPEVTRQLKKSSSLDSKIGFHNFQEGYSSNPQYYPKRKGASDWVEKLEKKLIDLGVHLHKGVSIKEFKVKDKKIETVELSTGESIENINEIVWTVPTEYLLKTLKVDFPEVTPKFIKTILTFFVLDKKPIPKTHFFFCYDVDLLPFRVTLYSNWQPDLANETNRHRICVETLADKSFDIENIEEKLLAQLKQMKIVEPDANCLYQKTITVPSGFPILDNNYYKNSELLKSLIFQNVNNVKLIGRGNAKTWFMTDVFSEVYETFGKSNGSP